MTKTIKYKKKTTTANTQYNATTSWDLAWILDQCQRLVQVAADCEQHRVIEGQSLYTKSPRLPKQSTGKNNSPQTMCQGVIDNFNKGQYDLSEKQMTGITESFNIASDVIEDFESVTFEEVSELPKLRSQLPKPIESAISTFESLFDNFTINVTLNRKTSAATEDKH